MENNAVFEQVRLLLRDDDTPGALHLLIEKLKDNNAFDEVVRTLRVIEIEVLSAKQNERKGILTYNEARPIYSKAIDSIHGIIDDLERGRVPQTIGRMADTAPAPTTSSSSRKALVAIFSLVFLVVAGWMVFKKLDEPQNEQAQVVGEKTDVCPSYTGEGIRVLILPFQSLKIDSRYVFTQTKRSGKTDFQSVPNLTSLAQGKIYRTMEDAVFSICSIMAIRERNHVLALKWLDKIETPTPDDKKMHGLLASNPRPLSPAKSNLRRNNIPLIRKAGE